MSHTKLDAAALEAATMALLHKEANPAPNVDWEASRTGTVNQWKERVYYAVTAYLDAAPEIAVMEQRIAELEKDASEQEKDATERRRAIAEGLHTVFSAMECKDFDADTCAHFADFLLKKMADA